MGSRNPFGTCRYCGRSVMWIHTKAGRNMPVNPELVTYLEVNGGRERIVTQDGKVVAGEICDQYESEGVGYISHFATCSGKQR